MAVLDGDHKRRRRLGTALTALKLQDSKGNPNWRLLSVIAILILFMLSIPGSGGEGIALFARRRGPSRVQLKAQRDQLAFCTKILSQSGGAMPFQVQLEWSGDGELQQFDPAAQGIGIQVNPEPGAVLRRVDGLEPLLLPKNNTYSMYVFDRAGNMNSDIVSDSMLINRQWESTEIVAHLNHLQRLHLELQVPKHEIFFIDIGANIGAFTMAVAAAGYSVIAIEAMAVNQHALRLSLCTSPALSSLVTVLPVALGKEPATCSLYSAPHNVLDGTIRCEGREFAPGSALIKRQDVDIVRLDDVLADLLPRLEGRVAALKMDTEGFEPWVVQGGQTLFSKIKPNYMQLEVSDMTPEATGVGVHEFMTWFSRWGYAIQLTPYSSPISVSDVPVANSTMPANVYLTRAELIEPPQN